MGKPTNLDKYSGETQVCVAYDSYIRATNGKTTKKNKSFQNTIHSYTYLFSYITSPSSKLSCINKILHLY